MIRTTGSFSSSRDLDAVWRPDSAVAARSQMAAFATFVGRRHGLPLDGADYGALYRWSIDDSTSFWAAVWEYFDVVSHAPYSAVLADAEMPGHGWFTGAQVNYAEHALRGGTGEHLAVIAEAEDGRRSELTWAQLREQVGALADWLRSVGVQPGDRVVGYLPNTEHAVVAFLASAAVGAVWSCCGPDYGAHGALSRLAQLEPVVLFAVTGYRWNGHTYDRRDQVAELQAGLPALRATVTVAYPYTDPPSPSRAPGTIAWQDTVREAKPVRFAPMPAESPLWVLFSSGTTGIPKGIVHSHAGILVEHLKQLGLHYGLGPGNRFCWYTTTNWMMWNFMVSGLLVGATIVTYDGSPTYGGVDRLWRLAAEQRVDVLGTSPAYLHDCLKANGHPARSHDLARLKILGVTGSPLPAQTCHWACDHLPPGVQISSASGGTDVATAFATTNPLTPVWAGELSAPALAVALDVWTQGGQPAPAGQVGELVITAPMPSMPVCFWNDPRGERYRDAYFGIYPGVWRHGDWVMRTQRGGLQFTGRSDATLNRNGVRFGSADIYAALDDIPGLTDTLVVGVELADGSYWMPLFIEVDEGVAVDTAMKARIRHAVSSRASPRHVPDDIIVAPGIPHTRTGKRLEVPIKRLLQGADAAQVVNPDAVDRPELLNFYQHVTPPTR